MIIPHVFADKRDEQLSLAWLDENFTALMNKIHEVEDRLNAQGLVVAEQNTIILQQADAIAKLQPKPSKAKS